MVKLKGETMIKDIAGYEGLYQVGYDGRVYSTPSDGKPNRELKQEQLVNHHTTYRRVTLSKDGKTTRFMVHRLVAEAFIDNPENKPHINHIDNMGENNYDYNLEWCTPAENNQHSAKQGRQHKVRVAGGKAAGGVLRRKAIARLSLLTSPKFILLENPVQGRSLARLHCSCGRMFHRRSDLVKEGSQCRSCVNKKKTIKMVETKRRRRQNNEN